MVDNFEYIHQNKEKIEDIKEIIEYKSIKKETINKYKRQLKEGLKNDEEIIGELLLEIRHKYGVSLREMSKMFNIDKDKLNKYIHKDKSSVPLSIYLLGVISFNRFKKKCEIIINVY